MSLTPASIVVVAPGQLSSDVDGDVVILNLDAGIYHGLSAVGARVWQLLQEPKRVADLCAVLLREYDVEPERCERAVLALLGELTNAGLVEVHDPPG